MFRRIKLQRGMDNPYLDDPRYPLKSLSFLVSELSIRLSDISPTFGNADLASISFVSQQSRRENPDHLNHLPPYSFYYYLLCSILLDDNNQIFFIYKIVLLVVEVSINVRLYILITMSLIIKAVTTNYNNSRPHFSILEIEVYKLDYEEFCLLDV